MQRVFPESCLDDDKLRKKTKLEDRKLDLH